MNILIVDDNEKSIYMLETLLKSCSYDVVIAANGVEALANLREGEIDLIISDILMPQMDGFRLCRECKKDNKLRDIPFVFYTATYTEEKDEEFSMKLGAARFIRKPEEPDKLIEIIQDVISNTVSGRIEPQKAISEEEKEIFKLYSERLVNKLEKKMLDLETEVSERTKHEAKVTHLNLVLRAIRSVNQLIIREKDPEKLIRQACMNLIATRGYSFAWITLLDKNNKLKTAADAGLGKRFTPLAEQMKKGRLNECTKRALKRQGVKLIKETKKNCGDCPLLGVKPENRAMTIRLEHEDKIYGALSVSVPEDFSTESEEQGLFEEIAGDIAFALHDIEIEEEKKNAEKSLQENEEKYRTVFENTGTATCILDNDGTISLTNFEFTQLAGYTIDEIQGKKTWMEFVVKEDMEGMKKQHELRRKDRDKALKNYEFRFIDKEGNIKNIFLTIDVIPGTKKSVASLLDITGLKKAEVELRKVNRALKALSECNQAVIRAIEESNLLHEFCRIIKETGGYRMAWIGFVEQDENKTVRPVSQAGFEEGYLETLNITWADTEQGRGPTGTAIRKGKPAIAKNILTDPCFAPWRDEATRRGYASSMALPLISGGQTFGALNIYAAEPEAFNEEEAKLLVELADDLAYGITIIRVREKHKQAEEALKSSEERLKILFEYAPDAYYLNDHKGNFIDGNKAAEVMLGYKKEELIGKSFFKINMISAKEILKAAKILVKNIRGKSTGPDEFILNRKDGSKVPVEIKTHPLKINDKTVVLGIARDITWRKQAEAELIRERELINALIDNSPDNIYLKDKKSRFIRINKNQSEGFDLRDPAEAIGKTDFDFFTEEHASEAFEDEREVIRTGQSLVSKEEKETWPDGTETWVSTTKLPLYDAEGNIIGTCGISRDITDRKQAEEELRKERASLSRRVKERTADLSKANAELAKAAKMKDEFLASMSHELRTPLNAVLGLSEALQEEVYGEMNQKQHKSLRSIEESGRHLLSLINDILDIAKIEAGKVSLEINQVPIEVVCQASLRLIKQTALKKNLQLTCNIKTSLMNFGADERRLKQILINLLSNAVKFTPEGGEVGIEVTDDADKERINFTVWDTGIGITKESMDKLFQPFIQIDSSLTREYSGTGLGLALVKHLTELHGGSITVESEPGEGSRFTITLPVETKTVVPALEAEEGEDKTGKIETGKQQEIIEEKALILLAEDNEKNIEMLSDYLLAKGYSLMIARNGKEAVEVAKERTPDLILMDIQMPGMDGLEAAKIIRNDKDPKLAKVPVIALTALVMPGDKEKCLAAGADDYLKKPVGLKYLVKRIEEILGSSG